MSDDDQPTFEGQGAGSAETYPQKASACRQGSMLMIEGHPCKIISMSISKTGKHGHAKCKFMAIDIFTGAKMDKVETSTHNVEVPNVTRNEYQLLGLDDDALSLMTDNGDTKDDLNLPADAIGEKITELWDDGNADADIMVTVLSALGIEKVIDVKVLNT